MTDRVARLQRLHALRCRLADAAAADRERTTQQVRFAEEALRALSQTRAVALRPELDGACPSWRERIATLQVAALHQESWSRRRSQSKEAEEAALLQERLLRQEREQVSRILERRQMEDAAVQQRREQARMDDLFATSRTRAAMTTAF